MAKRDYQSEYQSRVDNGVVVLYSDNAKPTAEHIYSLLKSRGVPVELGGLEQKFFSGGEFYAKVTTNIRRRIVIYVHDFGTDPNIDIVKLGITGDAISRADPETMMLVAAFLPWARQDRKKRGEAFSAKWMANVISMIPKLGHIITFDLHAPQVAGFFRDDISFDNIAGHATFMPHIRKYLGQTPETSIAVREGGPLDTGGIFSISDICIGTTDVGGSKKGRDLAEAAGINKLVITDKRRDDDGAEAMNLIGTPTKKVIMFDDIADTIGSILSAYNLFIQHGAEEVDVYISHLLMSGPARERLKSVPGLRIIAADSIPRDQLYLDENPQIEMVEQRHLIGEIVDAALRKGGSISRTVDRWIDGTFTPPM